MNMSSVPSNNNYFSEDVGMGIAAGMSDSTNPFARAMGRSMGTTIGSRISRKEREKELLLRKQEIEDQIERVRKQREEDRANAVSDIQQQRGWKTEDEASRRIWAETQATKANEREIALEKFKASGPDFTGINAGVMSKGLFSPSGTDPSQEAMRKMMLELLGPNVRRASGSPETGFNMLSPSDE